MKAAAVLFFLFASWCFALDPGDKAGEFSLKATDGKQVKLSDYKDKTVVVIFVATRCPYSNAFNKVMASLSADYAAKGIVVLGINANKSEAMDEVIEHTKEHFAFPVLKDQGNKIADAYNAQVTPEAFLIDADGVIRYHGALGSSNRPTTDASKANGMEIRAALDELLAGKAVSRAKTKAFGCTIKRM